MAASAQAVSCFMFAVPITAIKEAYGLTGCRWMGLASNKEPCPELLLAISSFYQATLVLHGGAAEKER
jgi:hypothetical protein